MADDPNDHDDPDDPDDPDDHWWLDSWSTDEHAEAFLAGRSDMLLGRTTTTQAKNCFHGFFCVNVLYVCISISSFYFHDLLTSFQMKI